MQEPTGAWVPKLEASLQRSPDEVHRSGEYVTTRYSVVPGQETVLEDGLTDLVMFMYVAVAAAADNPSWRSGGLISARTWGRLLKVSDGERDNLKAYLGEVLAWWHEETSPAVAYAGRPSPSTSQPVIDSLSLRECEGGRVVRAVQAKATFGAPRARCNEALTKFARLQTGDYDEAWADASSEPHYLVVCHLATPQVVVWLARKDSNLRSPDPEIDDPNRASGPVSALRSTPRAICLGECQANTP